MWTKFSVMAGALAATSFASAALADSLQCNKEQTRCLTETRDLTIGDRVGIFNDDGELVATGEVSSMRGARRAVNIQERHGRINKGYDLALLETPKTMATSYRIYREPAAMVVGGSFGYGRVSIGDGSPQSEFSGYMMWRKWGGVELIGRAVFSAMEGSVSRTGDFEGVETSAISMHGFGLLGGAGYTLRHNRTVGFRGEAGLGIMQVSASIDGDTQLVNDASSGFNTRIKNGMAPYGRWSAGTVINFEAWRMHADLVQSLVHAAFTNEIALGASFDMR